MENGFPRGGEAELTPSLLCMFVGYWRERERERERESESTPLIQKRKKNFASVPPPRPKKPSLQL